MQRIFSPPTVDGDKHFHRRWNEPPLDLERDGRTCHVSVPVGRILRRVERQRKISHLVRLLQSAQQQDDAVAVVAAFREAERLRQEIGLSWSQLIIEKRAA